MTVTVVVVADAINKKLSVYNPAQLTTLGDAIRASTHDTVRKVMFESQRFADDTEQSATDLSTAVVHCIRASFVMESLRFILYWGSTALVPTSFYFSKTSSSPKYM